MKGMRLMLSEEKNSAVDDENGLFMDGFGDEREHK
jgi:hypothetical protein